MQLVKSLFTTALFVAALAEAKVSFTATPSSAQVGKQANIGWTGATDPVTVLLKKGDPKDLKTVDTLTKDTSGTSYQWTPSSDLASGKDYALEIKSGDETNYSGQFEISGGKAPAKMAQEEAVSSSSSAAVSASTVTPSTAASTAASASAPSGTAAASGAAKPSASASASASGSGAKSTSNSPPMSNGSLRNIASPLALIAGVAAAMYLQ